MELRVLNWAQQTQKQPLERLVLGGLPKFLARRHALPRDKAAWTTRTVAGGTASTAVDCHNLLTAVI